MAEMLPSITARSEAQPFQTGRQLEGVLNPQVPLSFETNTSLWFSTSQTVGRLNDLLGASYRLDASAFWRAALFFGAAYTNWAATYYSHELAHKQIYGYYRLNQQYKLDAKDWSRLVPELDHDTSDRRDAVALAVGLRSLRKIHGIVQQKLNARRQFQHDVVSPAFHFDEGIAFLFNTTADQWYFVEDALSLHPDSEDISDHLDHPENRLTRGRWFLTSLFSSLATFHAWESGYASYRYLAHGERQRRPWRLVSRSLQLAAAPPRFQTMPMPHPGGLYVEGSLPIHNLLRGGEWCFIDGGGDVHRDEGQRVGLEVLGWNPFFRPRRYIPRLNGGFYKTFSSADERPDGIALQGGLAVALTEQVSLEGKIKHARNDLLENRILGKGGFQESKGTESRRLIRPVSETTEGFLGLTLKI